MLVMKYKNNSFFKHPETMEEFRTLQEQAIYFKNIGDINGLNITLWRLVPDLVAEEENSDTRS